MGLPERQKRMQLWANPHLIGLTEAPVRIHANVNEDGSETNLRTGEIMAVRKDRG
jgi:hypothetical protein